MKTKRTLIGIIVILAVLLVIAIIQFLPEQQPDKIKIGVTLPLTGDGAPYGKEALDGLRLAVEELNKKGGIGNKMIGIYVEDDMGTANGGVAALHKLLAIHPDMQVVIGGAFSQIAAAQMPICDKKGIVLFSPYASNPDLSKPDDCLFRNWPSDTAEGENMAKYAFNKLGMRRIAVLTSNSDYGIGLKRVFEKEFKALSGEILITEEFAEGENDFRPQLTKIKETSPDALYLVGWYKEFAIILKQAKELGLDVQVLSCVTFNKPELLQLAGGAAEGAIFTQPAYNTDSNNPITSKFVETFENKYGSKPGIYAAQAYDAVYLLAEAAKRGITANEIKQGLYAIKDYPGVTGQTTFDENGDVEKLVQFWTVKNNQYVQILE